MALRIIACIAIGYFLGSWNGAILISRARMHEDIREKGSGNAGMTNFLRNYGGIWTLMVVLIDFGKAIAACLIATLILPQEPAIAKGIAGFAVQIGHIFPMFFHFHGGKGVLCSAAVALMLDWRIFLIALSFFLVLFFLTRYVSLASMLAVSAFAALTVVFLNDQPVVWILILLMASVVIFMHRSNIVRLLKGEERKTYFHKEKNEREAN